jgi:hypothetical protein
VLLCTILFFLLFFFCNREDVVEVDHWCDAEGRIAARFDYIIKNLPSGEVIGRTTRSNILIVLLHLLLH